MTPDLSTGSVLPRLLAACRVGLGALYAGHGAQLALATGGAARWVALAQFAAGALMLTGVASRVAAVLCGVVTAYGFLLLHLAAWPSHSETAAMLSWGLLLVAVAGPGAWRRPAAQPTRR